MATLRGLARTRRILPLLIHSPPTTARLGVGIYRPFSSDAAATVSATRRRRRTRPPPPKDIVSITEDAAKRMKVLLDGQDDPTVTGIRLGVRSRGCSGKSYTMNYAHGNGEKGDELVEQRGVRLFVDSKAILFVVGTVVDWQEDHLKAEFVFMNPQSKGECGCGESFNV